VIEHERARSELKAQALELRASRRRLVEASDRERRRLEHDLHDGAQQQLVSLLVALATNPGHAAASTVAAAERHVQAAITELRALTHGLFPPVLTHEGLGPAIEDLELSSSTIVEILELPTLKAPPLVESTAYLAAALAVASGPAVVRLRVRSTSDSVVIEALGATSSDSLEWHALSERVAALEGRIDTSSDSIKVTLPCVS
jgi:signal transduction histidine kinase